MRYIKLTWSEKSFIYSPPILQERGEKGNLLAINNFFLPVSVGGWGIKGSLFLGTLRNAVPWASHRLGCRLLGCTCSHTLPATHLQGGWPQKFRETSFATTFREIRKIFCEISAKSFQATSI